MLNWCSSVWFLWWVVLFWALVWVLLLVLDGVYGLMFVVGRCVCVFDSLHLDLCCLVGCWIGSYWLIFGFRFWCVGCVVCWCGLDCGYCRLRFALLWYCEYAVVGLSGW